MCSTNRDVLITSHQSKLKVERDREVIVSMGLHYQLASGVASVLDSNSYRRWTAINLGEDRIWNIRKLV